VRTRTLGPLEVSVVGLGCNNFGGRVDEAGTRAVIDAALDAGVTFFDTADIYGNAGGSETLIGKILDGRRDQVVLATKFGMKVDEQRQGARPAYVRAALDDSLKRLQTDRIDLYQLHQPDPSVPIADTLGALDQAVRAGKVREIGCSNFSAAQLREAEAAVRDGAARFVSVQNEYSLLKRDPEAEVLPECERLGLAFLPYFPLASGLLTGKYRRGRTTPEGARIQAGERFGDLLSAHNLDAVEALVAFAEARHHSLLELAFSWLLSHRPVASVIAGATSPEQVQSNARAAAWRLTPSELAEIDESVPR
jgi:aryl-alcohol dehydrogenase-like predicted oxidoreductase